MTVAEVAARAEIPQCGSVIDARTLTNDKDIAEAGALYGVWPRHAGAEAQAGARHASGWHTVAMTGDGVNDVLALKEADCSVAMASGSQVACQVSHIVLLESDFSAMPSVVAEGRRVINNIERSASLHLVKEYLLLCLAIISLIFTFTYPFSAAQLSLVSALTIGLPSFVMALEPKQQSDHRSFPVQCDLSCIAVSAEQSGSEYWRGALLQDIWSLRHGDEHDLHHRHGNG